MGLDRAVSFLQSLSDQQECAVLHFGKPDAYFHQDHRSVVNDPQELVEDLYVRLVAQAVLVLIRNGIVPGSPISPWHFLDQPDRLWDVQPRDPASNHF